MEGCTNLGLLFQNIEGDVTFQLDAACLHHHSSFLQPPLPLWPLQALLLNSDPCFFYFSEKMAEQQEARKHTLYLCGKEHQEELAAELGVPEESNKHKLLLGENGKVISKCETESGTPLWKSTMNSIAFKNSNINWIRIWFVWLKKSTTGAGSCLPVKLALPLMAHTCTEAHSSCLNLQKIA